jgi:hypothetical protein
MIGDATKTNLEEVLHRQELLHCQIPGAEASPDHSRRSADESRESAGETQAVEASQYEICPLLQLQQERSCCS